MTVVQQSEVKAQINGDTAIMNSSSSVQPNAS